MNLFSIHASRLIAIATEVAFTKMQSSKVTHGLKVLYVIVCFLFARKSFEDVKCSSFLPFLLKLCSARVYYECQIIMIVFCLLHWATVSYDIKLSLSRFWTSTAWDNKVPDVVNRFAHYCWKLTYKILYTQLYSTTANTSKV